MSSRKAQTKPLIEKAFRRGKITTGKFRTDKPLIEINLRSGKSTLRRENFRMGKPLIERISRHNHLQREAISRVKRVKANHRDEIGTKGHG